MVSNTCSYMRCCIRCQKRTHSPVYMVMANFLKLLFLILCHVQRAHTLFVGSLKMQAYGGDIKDRIIL